MTSTAWTFPVPREGVQEFRDLMTGLHDDLSGLAGRTGDVGYHRERMWLRPDDEGSAEFIVHLEFDDGVDVAVFAERLLAHESGFTRWWTPRFESFGLPRSFGEPVLSWDAEVVPS